MEPGTSEFTAVIDRLERLEKQNRRFKQIGALALILLGSVFLMGQASPPRTVEANEFVLKDAQGRVRARLQIENGDPKLVLLDADGNNRVVLEITNNNPALFLQNKEGYAVASLVSVSNEPSLFLNGGDGSQTIIGVRPSGTDQTSAASMVLFDKDKKVLWEAP